MAQHTISKQYIQQFLPSDPIILEAGAHIGRDTLKMIKLWPNATIHAFEPAPHLFEQLQNNTQEIATIHRYPLALSDTTGTQTFYVSHGINAVSSLLEPTDYFTPQSVSFTPIDQKTITLHEWARHYGIQYIDFAWLDMQGFEYAMLKASPEFLSHIHVMLIEVAQVHRYKNDVLFETLKEFLQHHNFIVDTLAIGHKGWGNALFINQKFMRK